MSPVGGKRLRPPPRVALHAGGLRRARESDFWSSAALGLLASLILAARVAEADLGRVWEWLNDSAAPGPGEALAAAGLSATAAGPRGRQAGAVETREGSGSLALSFGLRGI